MPIAFDRSVCCDLNETISREWLIANGRGSSASGTIAGVLTRMQHGLLVVSPPDAATPQLLLAKIDEEVAFDQRTYYLGTNEYREGTLNPSGFVHLETFRLEEGFPVFTYRLGGIDGVMLEKRIWMPHGQNTTYIQYRVIPNNTPYEPANDTLDWSSIEKTSNNSHAYSYTYPEATQRVLNLTLLPFTAHRPYHQPQYGNNDWHFNVLPLPTLQNPSPVGAPLAGTLSGDQGTLTPPGVLSQPVTLPKGVAGCTIRAWEGAQPYHLLAVGHPESATTLLPTGVWYWKFLRRHDRAAGLPPTDDLYLPGVIRTKLWPGEDATLTLIVTTEDLSTQVLSPGQLNAFYKRSVEYERSVLQPQPQRYFGEGGQTAHSLHILPITSAISSEERPNTSTPGTTHQLPQRDEETVSAIHHPQLTDEELLRLLLQAGERFLTQRTLPKSECTGNHPLFASEVEHVPALIRGYYAIEDNTRDTLIALPGLTLATGHFDEARRMLSVLARYFKQGMLPDRLPTSGSSLQESDYRSVDTTLWYFYALDHYLRMTRDYELLHDLYQRLVNSIDWYIQGTYNSIQVDAHDKLLRAQAPGKALTWMNAIAHDVPITPRQGKAVEVNALWYHALSLMHEWSQTLYSMGHINHTTTNYQQLSEQCKNSFQTRFWYSDGGYLYDVIDSPHGNDPSLRPNQLLAISLRHPVLAQEHQHAVFDQVTRHLLTPYGLRTLAPHEAAYQGHLKENQEEQPGTLHQGSAWSWLIGPYIDALLYIQSTTRDAATPSSNEDSPPELRSRTPRERAVSMYPEPVWRKALHLLQPFCQQLYEDMLGNIASTFDGDEPHKPGYLAASAMSVGEMLRVYKLLTRISTRHFDQALLV